VQAGQGEESETPLARDQQPSTPEATDTSSTTAADPRLPPASSLQPPASHVQPAASSPSPSFRDRLKVAWYWLAWTGCQIFCAVFFRVRVSGRESVPRNGACLLAGNHQSYMDPVFCGVGVRRRLTFVARDTLFRYRLFAALIHSLNAIPIERDKPDVSAIKAIIARLRAGEAVCLYPEATRTRDGRIVPFKPGFGLLCRRARAAVVPVLVDGAFECWPRHRRLFAPGHVTIWYGRPLDPDEIRTLTNEQLADRLTATLRQMQHDCRLRRGKQPYDYAAAPSADRQPQ